MIINNIVLLIIMAQNFNIQPFTAVSNISESNDIEWNLDRKLKWDDFKADPPLLSVTKASASANCGFDVSAATDSKKGLTEVTIKNIFYGNKSWVREDKKHRLDLLVHEQGHFDLCEVYARLLRKRVVDSNYKLDVDTAIQEVFDAFRARQKMYDLETDHSIKKDVQLKWLKTIAHELVELENYSKQ